VAARSSLWIWLDEAERAAHQLAPRKTLTWTPQSYARLLAQWALAQSEICRFWPNTQQRLTTSNFELMLSFEAIPRPLSDVRLYPRFASVFRKLDREHDQRRGSGPGCNWNSPLKVELAAPSRRSIPRHWGIRRGGGQRPMFFATTCTSWQDGFSSFYELLPDFWPLGNSPHQKDSRLRLAALTDAPSAGAYPARHRHSGAHCKQNGKSTQAAPRRGASRQQIQFQA